MKEDLPTVALATVAQISRYNLSHCIHLMYRYVDRFVVMVQYKIVDQLPAADLKEDLAHHCIGYCGADLKVQSVPLYTDRYMIDT